MCKYLLSITCLLLCLCSCGPDKHHFRLKGEFKNLTTAEFYIYSEYGGLAKVDTIKIEKGKFEYETPLEKTDILTLQYPNFSRTFIIATPGTALQLKGDANHLDALDISGDTPNERLTELRLKLLNLPANNTLLAASQFIRDHADELEATLAFKLYFASNQSPNVARTLPLLDLLVKKQPSSSIVQALNQQIRPRLLCSPGQTLPTFTTKDLKGNVINNQTLKGRPTLIFFWASWNNESSNYLTSLLQLKSSYPQAFNLVTISLDPDKKRCENILNNTAIDYINICDGQAFNSPLVQTLCIQNIPGNLIVDAQGKIIARDLSYDQLQQKLSAYLH